MRFALLIYQPDPFDPNAFTAQEHAAIGAEYGALSSAPNVTPGPPLGSPTAATTVRVRDGRLHAQPGPYVSVAGALGGFMIIEADAESKAIAMAGRIPAARLGGAVEVRPCGPYWNRDGA